MPARRRTKFDGISPQATKELIALQEDFAAEVRALRAETVGNTTDTKQRGQYAARFNERVRVQPDATAGLDLGFPEAGAATQNQWIEVLHTGGGACRVTATGGTVQKVAVYTITEAGSYYFQSDGASGWLLTPVVSASAVFAQIYPVGSIYISTNSTNPATTLGFGTWAAFGAGQVPVGFAAGDPDFGVDEGTGGAKTVASAGTNTAISAGTPSGSCTAPTFTGSSASTNLVSAGTPSGTNSAPTFTGAAMATHQHQLPFGNIAATPTNTLTSFGTSGSIARVRQITTAAAVAGSEAAALSQGVSAGTPSGTVSAPTFTGAALGTHQHTVTATGTNSAPAFTGTPMVTHNHTFTGSATSVLQPFITVRMWKRTA